MSMVNRRPSVVTALVDRWPTGLALVSAVVIFADGGPPVRPLAVVLASMPAIYLVLGVLRGRLRTRRIWLVQLAGLVGFGAIAAAASVVDGDAGRYLVAAGWLGHGVWDLVHHRLDLAVPRPYAEWCGVLDVLGAVLIVALG